MILPLGDDQPLSPIGGPFLLADLSDPSPSSVIAKMTRGPLSAQFAQKFLLQYIL